MAIKLFKSVSCNEFMLLASAMPKLRAVLWRAKTAMAIANGGKCYLITDEPASG